MASNLFRDQVECLAARSLSTVFALAVLLTPAGCSDSKSPTLSDVTKPPMDAGAGATDAGAGATEGGTGATDAAVPGTTDAAPDATAHLSLFAAGATQASVVALVPDFATQNGLTIDFTFGSAGSLRDQILSGTSGADVALVTPAVIAALDAKSLVHTGSRVDLGQIGGGLAVRSADELPDISDSDKFKAALLAADEIYYADPALATAGAAFVKICGTLDITDACAPAPAGKGHIAAGGAEAMAAMALSAAVTVVGVTQISEIKVTPGVKLVGEYPDTPVNLQVKTVYSAIIVEGTQSPASAQLLLQFLSGDAFKTQLAAYGFDPIAAP